MKKSEIKQLFINDTMCGDYKGNFFLIVESWEFIQEIEKLCKRSFDDSVIWLFGDNTEWGFSDEYTLCSECSNTVIKTSPDSYCWTADYYLGDGVIACSECAQNFLDERIDSIQDAIEHNKQPHSLEDIFNLSPEWQQIDGTWENGLHHGMNCDPLRQGKIVHAYKQDGKRLFDVCYRIHPSQFYTEWETYIRVNPDNDLSFEITPELLTHISNEFDNKANFPYDIATLCENALKQASNFTKINFDPNTGEIKNQNFNSVEDMYPNLK
jgi:hypothetical protein